MVFVVWIVLDIREGSGVQGCLSLGEQGGMEGMGAWDVGFGWVVGCTLCIIILGFAFGFYKIIEKKIWIWQ